MSSMQIGLRKRRDELQSDEESGAPYTPFVARMECADLRCASCGGRFRLLRIPKRSYFDGDHVWEGYAFLSGGYLICARCALVAMEPCLMCGTWHEVPDEGVDPGDLGDHEIGFDGVIQILRWREERRFPSWSVCENPICKAPLDFIFRDQKGFRGWTKVRKSVELASYFGGSIDAQLQAMGYLVGVIRDECRRSSRRAA